MFDEQLAAAATPGSEPRHEHEETTFNWPDNLKSTLNPIDPYNIGLRTQPCRGRTESLFETKKIKLTNASDKVVQCWLLTAFFYVEIPTNRRSGAGYGIRLDDSDSEASTPRKRRRDPNGQPKQSLRRNLRLIVLMMMMMPCQMHHNVLSSTTLVKRICSVLSLK